MRLLLSCCMVVFVLANVGVAKGDITYDESIDGDLGAPAAPTDLGLAGLGLNTVTGQINTNMNFDPDAFSFTVDAGH